MPARRCLLLLGLLTACELSESIEPPGQSPVPRRPPNGRPASTEPRPPQPPPVPTAPPAPRVAPPPQPCPPVAERREVPDPGGLPSIDGTGALLVTAVDAATGAALPPTVWLTRARPLELEGAVTPVSSELLWIALPAGGPIKACISSPGYETICRAGLGVLAGATLPVHVKLRRNVIVTGRVLTVAAERVVGAAIGVSSVRSEELPGCWTVTDAEGFFRCDTLTEGAYRLEVRPVGIAGSHTVRLEARPKTPPLDIRLPPTASVTLRFQLPKHVPSDTSIRVQSPYFDADISPQRPDVHQVFFVQGQKPGPVELSVSEIWGTASMKPMTLAVAAGESVDRVVQLRWKTSPRYQGPYGWHYPKRTGPVPEWVEPIEPELVVRLVDPFGEAIERFHVASVDLAYAARCSQDQRGRAIEEWAGDGFVWLARRGRFLIDVWLEDGRMGRGEIEVTYESGRQVLTIPLERKAGFRARLVDAESGLPIKERRFAIDGQRFGGGATETDDEGRFLSLPIEPGEHQLLLDDHEPVLVRSCPGIVVDLGELPVRRVPRSTGAWD